MISSRAASLLLSVLLSIVGLRTEAGATSSAHAVLRSDDGFTYGGDAEVVTALANAIPRSVSTIGSIVMQIPTIPGSSQVPGYAGAIDVSSLLFGVSVTFPVSGSGGSHSKPIPSPLTEQKAVDSATPFLELALFSGARLPNYPIVTLLHRPGYVPFAALKLTDASVSADSLSGSTGAPTENVSFAYDSVEYCVYVQNANGSGGTPYCSTYAYRTSAGARHLPRAAPAALVAANADERTDSAIYSTRVAFRGSDGHRYAGDAVVYPSRLFPVTRTTSGSRSPAEARARALSSGPFRFDSLFESPGGFDIRKSSYPTLDYLLYVPGVSGLSNVPGYQHWLDVQSFSIGFSIGSAGELVASDLHIQKQTDATSPQLWQYVNESTSLQNTHELTFLVLQQTSASTGLIYMSMTFSNGFADSYGLSAAYGSTETDSLSFTYSRVEICQYPSLSTGKQGTPNCATLRAANARG